MRHVTSPVVDTSDCYLIWSEQRSPFTHCVQFTVRLTYRYQCCPIRDNSKTALCWWHQHCDLIWSAADIWPGLRSVLGHMHCAALRLNRQGPQVASLIRPNWTLASHPGTASWHSNFDEFCGNDHMHNHWLHSTSVSGHWQAWPISIGLSSLLVLVNISSLLLLGITYKAEHSLLLLVITYKAKHTNLR